MKIIRIVFISCVGLFVLALVLSSYVTKIQQKSDHPPEVNNLPAYPGALLISDKSSQIMYVTKRDISWQTADSPLKVLDYYTTVLEQDTWKRVTWADPRAAPADTIEYGWRDAREFSYDLRVRSYEYEVATAVELTLISAPSS